MQLNINNEKRLEIINANNLLTGNVNSYPLKLEIDSSYKDYSITLVFKNNDKIIKQIITYETKETVIPHEILEKPGDMYIGLFADKVENGILIQRNSVNLVNLYVEEGSYTGDGEYTEPIDATILEKYLQEMKNFYDESSKEYNNNAVSKIEEYNNNATEKIKDFNSNYETKKSELDEVVKQVSADKEAVSEIKTAVETSEKNAKTSEGNAKTSETAAQNSANKASQIETNVTNIEKNINATKEQIDTIKTNIDGQVNTVNTLAENATAQATKSEGQAKISAENAAATSADKNAVSEMKSEVEEFKTEAKTSRDEAESFKNETLQAKEVVENSLENERIESEKRYAKAIDTEVITVDEFAQVELDEDGYMEDIVVEASKEITQEVREGYNDLKYPYVNTTKTKKGITFTDNGNGSITMNGTATENVEFSCQWENKVPTGSYSYITYGLPSDCYCNYYGVGNKYGEVVGNYNTKETEGNISLGMSIHIPSGVTVNNVTVYPMLVKGQYTKETIPAWEQYGVSPSLNYPSEFQNMVKEVDIQNNEYTSKISLSGSQFLGNFQGYKNAIDNGVVKGQLKELVLTGGESWTLFQTSTNTARFVLAKAPAIMLNSETEIMYLCNYFKAYLPSERVEDKEGLFVANSWYNEIQQNEIYIRTNINEISTVEQFKAKLKELYDAGTPVKILYVALEQQKQELSQENLQVVNSLQTYQGENNISTPEAVLSFKANKSIPSYVKEEIDKKIAQNNLSEREISDNKYPRALKKKVSETDFTQVFAENEKIEGLKIYGAELTQKTREGYNLVDFTNPSVSNSTSTFENNIFVTTGDESNSFTHSLFDITDIYVNNPGKILKFKYSEIDYSNTSDNDILVQLKIINSDSTEKYTALLTKPEGSASNGEHTIFEDVSNITQVLMQIFSNNTSTKGKYSLTIKEPMLLLGTEDKPYETYGVMPSLEYPSEVQVVSEQNIQVANENLISDTDNLYKTINDGNITIDVNEKGSIVLNGTPTANYIQLKGVIDVTDLLEDGETYTLYKTNSSGVYNQIAASKRDGSGNEHYANYNDKTTFTVDKNKYKSYAYNIQLGAIANTVTFNNYECNFMLLYGDYSNKEVAYIPHESTSSKISLPQDTFTGAIGDYKDTIKEVDGRFKVEKWIKKIILNGTENWLFDEVENRFGVYNLKNNIDSSAVNMQLCTHYKKVAPYATNIGEFQVGGDFIRCHNDNNLTLIEWKTYLAQQYTNGTPIEMYYILATPEYIDLPDETQEILNGIKLRLGLNNFSIDVGTFSYIYNKSIEKEFEEKDALIEELTSRILALENATLNLAEGE